MSLVPTQNHLLISGIVHAYLSFRRYVDPCIGAKNNVNITPYTRYSYTHRPEND